MSTNERDVYGFRKFSFSLSDPFSQNWFKPLMIALFIFAVIIKMATMCLAGYLSWNCFYEDMHLPRVFKTSIATTFSFSYLTFYFIKAIIFKERC